MEQESSSEHSPGISGVVPIRLSKPVFNRRCSRPIIPRISSSKIRNIKEIPDTSEVVDFTACGDRESIQAVIASLNALVVQQRSDMEEFLEESSLQMNSINDLCEKLHSLEFQGLELIRMDGIKHFLYHNMRIKRCQRILMIFEYNCRVIQALVDRLKALKDECFPNVNLDLFFSKFLLETNELPELNDKILRIEMCLKPIEPVSILSCDWTSRMLSKTTHVGKILETIIPRIAELSYAQVDSALRRVSSSDEMFLSLRNLVFDIAWTRVSFPFVQIRKLKFPDIGNLSPKSFNVPFLEEPYVSTPLRELNSTDWPGKQISESFIDLLICRNPFEIADSFWKIIQFTGRIITDLAAKSGNEHAAKEVGFDHLFSYLLISVFAFGVDELLEMMMYTSEFISFCEDNGQQQFAITHCLGLISHIQNIDVSKYHE